LKIRKGGVALAVLTAAALALSACGGESTAPEPTASEAEAAGDVTDGQMTVSVGWNQPFFSMNMLTSSGNATANANILYLTQSSFNYYDGDLNLVPQTDFGTYERISEDPLVVQYTINEGVQWSDGTPVGAADLILYWGAQNDAFDNVEPEYDPETGDITNQDALDAGVYFDGSSVAMNLISEFPEISEDGRTVTFTYDQPRSDWEASIGMGVPAHVVAAHALDIADPAEGQQAIIDAFRNNDVAALSPIARFWNSGFDFTSLPDDPSLYLSSGPYILNEFVENEYLTLVRNPDYTWGPIPSVDSITIRYTEDPMASVTALENGEVNLISPQSSVDVLAALDLIENVTYVAEDEGTYEHVDVIFDNGGPFDPAAYGGDEAKALAVRQAFLTCIPRQEIIDKLIIPLNPNAEIRQSYNVLPGAPNYDEVVAANGMAEAFGTGDPEAARAILEAAGIDTSTPIDVRFLYAKSNVRRANEYELIAASCGEAGFNVIDEGDEKWGSRLTQSETYDASLFGWQSTNTFALNGEANFVTGGLNNFAGYSNAEVDRLWGEMWNAADLAEETELLKQIETILVNDAFGTVLFQFPGVTAYDDTLQNVSTIPLSPTIFWNFWEWETTGSAEAVE
jgi:peptide/nickel transport system substrate-binding protein